MKWMPLLCLALSAIGTLPVEPSRVALARSQTLVAPNHPNVDSTPGASPLREKSLPGKISASAARLAPPSRIILRFTRPKVRTPGGKKGICTPLRSPAGRSDNLTAMVAAQGDDWTSTTAPTLLFYIPDAQTIGMTGTLRLQAQGENVMPPWEFAIAGTPGIVRLTLPATVQLPKEQPLDWEFEVTCRNGETQSVSGRLVVKPLSATLLQQVNRAPSDRAKAAVYRQAGLLLDAIATLAAAKDRDPLAQQDWQSLLQSLDLAPLANQRLITP
jgi:hypothetical protein